MPSPAHQFLTTKLTEASTPAAARGALLGARCDPALYGLTTRADGETARLHFGCAGSWDSRHKPESWLCGCSCHEDGGVSIQIDTDEQPTP